MSSQDFDLMSEADFTRRMVAKYRELLLSAAGLSSVTIDGQVVSYQDLEASYRSWTKKLATLDGTRPQLVSIDLSGAF